MKPSPRLLRLLGLGLLIGLVALLAVTAPAWAHSDKDRHSTVPKPADLQIDKDGPSSAKKGDTIAYTIKVKNGGPGDAQNVVVRDHLPPQVSYVSATSPCYKDGNNFVRCNLGTLKNGAGKTLKITVKIDKKANASQIVNWAEVSSSTPDKKFSNNKDEVKTKLR